MKKLLIIGAALFSQIASAEIISGVYEGRIPGGLFGWGNKGDCQMTIEVKDDSKGNSKIEFKLAVDELKYTFEDFDYNIERTFKEDSFQYEIPLYSYSTGNLGDYIWETRDYLFIKMNEDGSVNSFEFFKFNKILGKDAFKESLGKCQFD